MTSALAQRGNTGNGIWPWSQPFDVVRGLFTEAANSERNRGEVLWRASQWLEAIGKESKGDEGASDKIKLYESAREYLLLELLDSSEICAEFCRVAGIVSRKKNPPRGADLEAHQRTLVACAGILDERKNAGGDLSVVAREIAKLAVDNDGISDREQLQRIIQENGASPSQAEDSVGFVPHTEPA